MSRAARALLAGALALALVATACGDDPVAETEDGRITVQGSGPRRRVTITDEQGGTVTYAGRRLPAGFPRAVPRPDLPLTSATADATGATTTYLLTYTVREPGPAALDAYGARLTDAGLDVTAGTDGTLTASGPGWDVTAARVPANGEAPGTLVVTVAAA